MSRRSRRDDSLMGILMRLVYRFPWLSLPIAALIFGGMVFVWHYVFFNFIGGMTLLGERPFADVTKDDIAIYGGSVLGLVFASPVLIVGALAAFKKRQGANKITGANHGQPIDSAQGREPVERR